MKKTKNMSKKAREEKRAKVIIIAFAAVVILVLALALVQRLTQEEAVTVQYVITEAGHVHTASGEHVGSVEEIFGEGGIMVTEDGHVHAADGSHLGEIDVPVEETPAE